MYVYFALHACSLDYKTICLTVLIAGSALILFRSWQLLILLIVGSCATLIQNYWNFTVEPVVPAHHAKVALLEELATMLLHQTKCKRGSKWNLQLSQCRGWLESMEQLPEHDAAVSVDKCQGTPKPRGRVPGGKVWDSTSAKWVPDPQHAVNDEESDSDDDVPLCQLRSKIEAAQSKCGRTVSLDSAKIHVSNQSAAAADEWRSSHNCN